MKRYGRQYLPIGGIIGMMQYDLFHIYTVDAHTLLVIKNMRRLRYEDLREEFPLGEVYHCPSRNCSTPPGFTTISPRAAAATIPNWARKTPLPSASATD